METTVTDFAKFEAEAFADAPLVTINEQNQQSGKNVITNFDPVEKIPVLSADDKEYTGVTSNNNEVATYFIDVNEPGMYTVTVSPNTEVIHNTRLFLFTSYEFNRPLVDSGLYNNNIRVFMHQTRYRLVVHGVKGDYTLSVRRQP